MIALAMIGALMVASTPPRVIEVQGHRGARARFPENTLPAFRYAIEVGADVLELDVQVTKDDRLVVAHDPFVSRELCLDARGAPVDRELAIRSLTLEELSSFDCGSRKNPRFPEQRLVPKTPMPALGAVLELAKSAGVRVNVEAKSIPGRPELQPEPKLYARLVVDALRAQGMEGRATLQSFDHRILMAAHAIAPKLELAALLEDTFLDHAAMVRAAHAKVLSPNHLWITAEVVEAMHAIGVRVVPWTANTRADWERLVALGVDGIITDDPAALIALLREKKLRRSPAP